MTLAFSAGDAAYWGLAIFLVLLGVGSLFALVKLGLMFDKVSSLVGGAERDALPVVVKAGGTVDRVNYQLDKLDTVTDSAVSMADSADTAVRAVSTAITKPVEKVSGFTAGVAHGFASFRKNRNMSDAMDAAKDAARRREQDLAEDLRGAGPTQQTTRAADADAHADSHAEARPVAAAGADAEAGPGADPARRASLIHTPRRFTHPGRSTPRSGEERGTKVARSRHPRVTVSPIAWHQGHGSAPGGGWDAAAARPTVPSGAVAPTVGSPRPPRAPAQSGRETSRRRAAASAQGVGRRSTAARTASAVFGSSGRRPATASTRTQVGAPSSDSVTSPS